MTRKTYQAILPVSLAALMAIGFALSEIIPTLTSTFYLAYVVCGGVIVVVVDRLARRQLTEAVVDERITSIAQNASWVSFRIGAAILGIGGLVLIFAFPTTPGLKLLGIGALVSVSLQSLVYGIAYVAIQRHK
jgi:uncharacterized membrane protein